MYILCDDLLNTYYGNTINLVFLLLFYHGSNYPTDRFAIYFIHDTMIHDQTVHDVVCADQLSIAQLVLNVIGSQLREGRVLAGGAT